MGKKVKRKVAEQHVATAKAVGVVSYSPDIFVIFGAYSSRPEVDNVFVFPSRDDKEFSIPEGGKGKNYVLVLALDRLVELAPFADRIHRLLVFGRPTEVTGLGLPVVDAVIKNGKIVEELTHRVDTLRDKIETQAVDLPLVPVAVRKKSSKSKPGSVSLLDRLRALKEEFTGDKLEFENIIMIPTMLRLVREVNSADFSSACAKLKKFGVASKTSKRFHTYIEAQTASGHTIGRAARVYLWPKPKKKTAKAVSMEQLAEKYECEMSDLRLVVLSVTRLLENFVA